MTANHLNVSLFDLIMCLSKTTDLVSPEVADHQLRVAYIASGIAAEMGLSREEQSEVILAGAVHDFGALSLQERLECLDFEVHSPHLHSESAYLLLREFAPFRKVADIVRHHHLPWNDGAGMLRFDAPVPLESHILHLADRAAVLLGERRGMQAQYDHAAQALLAKTGALFAPPVTEAFLALAHRDYFWFDLGAPYLDMVVAERCCGEEIALDGDGLNAMGRLFGHAIDYRSRFTAVHSCGVAAIAEWLAVEAGMSAGDCCLMRVAGYMHDFGKLSVCREILEKPGPLDEPEMAQVRRHPYYAHRLLDPLRSLRTINEWVSFHHERLDGRGYPFRLKGDDIPLGARIMAVGDIFTALTEDRPYRAGMAPQEALAILETMVRDGALDDRLVALVRKFFPEVDALRREAQAEAFGEFAEFTTYLSAMASFSGRACGDPADSRMH